LGEPNQVQSFIPSHTKCISTLDVKIDGSLKVKICTLVITSCDASSNSKEKIKEEQASSDHVIVQEADNLKAEVKSTEAPKTKESEKKLPA